MATHREVELKYALTENEYRRLRRRLTGATTVRFTNTFFDTPASLLRKNGIGCRIRSLPGKSAILTVKHGGRSKGGLHNRSEVECPVPPAQTRRILAGKIPLASLAHTEPLQVLARLVGAKKMTSVEPLGNLSTSRTKFRFSNLIGELDRCRVGRNYFHELEVESEDPAKADRATRAWLEERGIPIRPESKTKLGRFFASLSHRSRRRKRLRP